MAFSVAGWLIVVAYYAWQSDPVSTSITTNPIADLDFPTVTVCPPRTTHTALNYDLMRADNKSLSDEDRVSLKTQIFEILTQPSHEEYIKTMVAAANKENLNEVFKGYQSVPEPFIGKSGFRSEVWSTNGSWHTPWFQEEYKPNYYTDDKNHHFVLNFTEIAKEVGKGSLVIEVEVEIRKEKGWEESVTYSEGSKYTSASEEKDKSVKKSWADAEAHCKEEGGHLASIQSAREQKEVETLSGGKKAWIGLEGAWLHGRAGGGGGLGEESGKTIGEDDCGLFNKPGTNVWGFETCYQKLEFICQKEIKIKKKTLKLKYNEIQIKELETVQLWYKYIINGKTKGLLKSWDTKKMTGMKVTWFIKAKNNKNKNNSEENITKANQNPYLGEMVKIASLSRSMSKSDIPHKAVQQKAKLIHDEMFLYSNMCRGGQIKPEFFNSTFDQIIFGIDVNMTNNTTINSEDIEMGFNMFSSIIFCSESVALSQFLHSLLSSQSPRTIIQATVNTIESGDIREAGNREAMNKFYHLLDKIFKLQFGKILLATIGVNRKRNFFERIFASDLPYFDRYKQEIDQCLEGVDCEQVEDLVKTLGGCYLMREDHK